MNLGDFTVRNSAQTTDGGHTVVTAYHPQYGEVTVTLPGYPVSQDDLTSAVIHAFQVKAEAFDAAQAD